MEYYITSIFASIIIFIIIQYAEYNKYKNSLEEDPYQEPFNLFKISNILLFFIVYLVITIGFFYLKPSIPSLLNLTNILNSNKQGGSGNKNKDSNNNDTINNDNEKEEEIDPTVLSKINDNFDTGFAPFNSDDDNEDDNDNQIKEENESSLSSMSSEEE